MDVFCDAGEIGSRFARYVIDLRRLFLFHGVVCGAAENFVDLAVKLEESRALRLDLPALLRNIRDLERGGISADEMLTVVALASGGEDLVDGRASAAGLMRTVGLLRMMLAGVGTWAESNGVERAAQVMETGAGMDAGLGSVAGSGLGSGEDRVFLELAIEELRLQLGDVTRRMRELEPRREMTEAHAALPEMAAGVMAESATWGEAADRAEMLARSGTGLESGAAIKPGTWEDKGVAGPVAVWEEQVEEQAGWLEEEARPEWIATKDWVVDVVAPDRAGVEWMAEARPAEHPDATNGAAMEGAAIERAGVERALMERAGAERAALEQQMRELRALEAERERAATWPLEERVATTLPFPERAPVMATGNVSGQQRLDWSTLQERAVRWSAVRAEKVRLGAVAAGLVLAMVGIYGSVRAASMGSASAHTASAPGASLPAKKEGSGVARAGDGASSLIAAGRPAAAPAGSATGRDAGGVDAAQTLPVKAEKPRVAVARGVAEKEVGTKELAAPAKELAVKERRDDAAVEAARGRKDGKFLFVPAEVMEKHLVSARRPVLPRNAQGGQGRVVLNAFIAKDGTVSRTDVVEGPPKLISSAMAAVSWRRYRPFLLRGKPAEVVTPVTVSYAGAR